jgi:hypothetical protein
MSWVEWRDCHALRLKRTEWEKGYNGLGGDSDTFGPPAIDHFDNYRIAALLAAMPLIDYELVTSRQGKKMCMRNGLHLFFRNTKMECGFNAALIGFMNKRKEKEVMGEVNNK